MSPYICHIQIDDMGLLAYACRAAGAELVERPNLPGKHFQFEDVRTYPPGRGRGSLAISHLIRIPGDNLEVAVGKDGCQTVLLWDGRSIDKQGKGCEELVGRIRQAYAMEKILQVAIKRGYRLSAEKWIEGGKRVILYTKTPKGDRHDHPDRYS